MKMNNDDKKFKQVEAAKKTLGDVTQELEALDVSALEQIVLNALNSIETATQERDDNPAYMKAKETCSDFNKGLNEVKKYQKAKITLALSLLESKGA